MPQGEESPNTLLSLNSAATDRAIVLPKIFQIYFTPIHNLDVPQYFPVISQLLDIHFTPSFLYHNNDAITFLYTKSCMLLLLFLWASFPEAESCNVGHVCVFVLIEFARLLLKNSQDRSSV